jgi:glycosyltransferase involved in cell wall biosynthesis
MISPAITAIICTHNRDRYLGEAIDSLLAQDCENFKVLVVDNASTDQTQQIVASRLHDKRLTYLYEPCLGLSLARNCGANHSQSEILAYLDDDAIATPHWLSTLQKAYQENEQLAIAGGKIILRWPDDVKIPQWLSLEMMGALGHYDLGTEPLQISQPGLTPRGLNYSLRRRFLEQVGGFNQGLGRMGTQLLSNEELYMTELALHQGLTVAYLPDALVYHQVAPERLKYQWFLRRAWWQGVSEYQREKLAGAATIFPVQKGLENMIRGIYKALKYWQDTGLRFENFLYAYGQIGYLSQWLKMSVFQR